MLMALGIPYESDKAAIRRAHHRHYERSSYLTSARVAEAVGPCPGYAVNEDPFLEVIRMHWNAVQQYR